MYSESTSDMAAVDFFLWKKDSDTLFLVVINLEEIKQEIGTIKTCDARS